MGWGTGGCKVTRVGVLMAVGVGDRQHAIMPGTQGAGS